MQQEVKRQREGGVRGRRGDGGRRHGSSGSIRWRIARGCNLLLVLPRSVAQQRVQINLEGLSPLLLDARAELLEHTGGGEDNGKLGQTERTRTHTAQNREKVSKENAGNKRRNNPVRLCLGMRPDPFAFLLFFICVSKALKSE